MSQLPDGFYWYITPENPGDEVAWTPVMDTDPWWKRLWARLLRRAIWHDLGYIDETNP